MKEKLTRQQYSDKFDQQMERFNYIPQQGEMILQCSAPYPDYWFMSNKGYLFSAYYNEARILKPNPTETGKKNKAGKRTGQSWEYEYKVEGEKNNRHVAMHKLMAEMFAKDEFVSDEERDVHHIQKRTCFDANQPQFCNRAENLQQLPNSVHKKATCFGNKTEKELHEEIMGKMKKSKKPVLFFTLQQLDNIVVESIKSSLAAGDQPFIVFPTEETDASKIQVRVYPVDPGQFPMDVE
ncbi:MAG: hypothetical protein PUA54_06315 [Coprococcus catus]|nr:hypothetical protein [Coprococcus catus]